MSESEKCESGLLNPASPSDCTVKKYQRRDRQGETIAVIVSVNARASEKSDTTASGLFSSNAAASKIPVVVAMTGNRDAWAARMSSGVSPTTINLMVQGTADEALLLSVRAKALPALSLVVAVSTHRDGLLSRSSAGQCQFWRSVIKNVRKEHTQNVWCRT